VVEEGARIKNSVILEGVRVGAHSWIQQSIIGWKSVVGKWARIQNVTVLGQDVTIRDELFVNGARILPHKEVTESLPDEGQIIM
jgi:mannose-1-phosphate guanylyltransferase